jgi:4-hydroxybenzoate polyprenyltransferase
MISLTKRQMISPREQQIMRHLRLIVLLARPAVILLLILFTATGLAQAGQGADTPLMLRALLPVMAFLLFSVAWNDLADEAIDRVNLPGRRPLALGVLTRTQFAAIGLAAGAVALAAAAPLGWPVLAVTAAGLALSAAYSLRPVRLADRGVVASLMLPACYVAVPYLTGLLAGGHRPAGGSLLLLAGLYLGFIGRIVLKDFRDVRGDALFGKRTFLIRHGRAWTCAFSAGCLTAGTGIILAAAHRPTALLIASEAGCLAGTLVALRALARDRGARRDESLITAVAILGRGMVLLLLAHLAMLSQRWDVLHYDAVMALLAVLAAGPALSAARHGPVSRLTVPDAAQAGPDAAQAGPDGAQAGPDGAQAGPDGAQAGPDGARVGLVAVAVRPGGMPE